MIYHAALQSRDRLVSGFGMPVATMRSRFLVTVQRSGRKRYEHHVQAPSVERPTPFPLEPPSPEPSGPLSPDFR